MTSKVNNYNHIGLFYVNIFVRSSLKVNEGCHLSELNNDSNLFFMVKDLRHNILILRNCVLSHTRIIE